MATLASDLALALDPVLLAQRVGITPDPWQRDLLRGTERETLMLCSRQSGKSTVAAVMGLHDAQYKPPALDLILSPSLRQSQELFRVVKAAHTALGDDACPILEDSSLRMELENGSRIVCLPGTEATVRGFAGVTRLIVDEASRVDDALYQAVRPMLAVSGGSIVLLSTPFGKRGFFFQEWQEGGPHWRRVKITADQCPRISPEWLAEEREKIGQWWYSQEYLCIFQETVDSVFRYSDVQGMLSADVQPLFGGAG
jgi:hypothetical protein